MNLKLKIIHYCPKCGCRVFVEPADNYYHNSSGCTLFCGKCHLSLIGVDLSVCTTCDKEMKKTACKKRFFTIVKSEEGLGV